MQKIGRWGDALDLRNVRRRRLEREVETASEVLVTVADVLMPFGHLVGIALTARGVPADRVPEETLRCIRCAIVAAKSPKPMLWLERQALLEEIEIDSMRWRPDERHER